MKKLAFALLCLGQIIAIQAMAKEEILATITTDEDNITSVFIASTDESTGRLKTFFKDNYQGGKKLDREALPTNGLANNGVILDQRGDRIVIGLKSTNFDFDRGGSITIDTLFSGITGERKNYEVDLAKDTSGWKIWNGKKAISKLHVVVNKVAIIGAVGVKTIRME